MPKSLIKSKRRGSKARQRTPMSVWRAANRLLNSERKTYRVRMNTAITTVNASGGGVVSGYILVDPAQTTYTETSDVKAMYSQYRIVASRLTIMPATGNTNVLNIVFASLLNAGIGTPSSYNQVADNANLLWVTNISFDQTGRPKTLAYSSGLPQIMFQDWGTNSTDYAGAPGGFYFYGSGATNSVGAFSYIVESIFEVRDRV